MIFLPNKVILSLLIIAKKGTAEDGYDYIASDAATYEDEDMNYEDVTYDNINTNVIDRDESISEEYFQIVGESGEYVEEDNEEEETDFIFLEEDDEAEAETEADFISGAEMRSAGKDVNYSEDMNYDYSIDAVQDMEFAVGEYAMDTYSEEYEEYEENYGERTFGNFYVAESGGIENEWIVVMKDQPGTAGIFTADSLQSIAYDVAEMTGTADIEVMNTFTNVFPGFTVKGMTEEAAREFTKDKRVAFVEQNFVASTAGTKNPKSWGLDRIDERNMPLDKCYAPMGNKDGSGVHAYIIDSGIRIAHNEFKNANGGRRARWGTNTIDTRQDDCNGHGTHVAGTVGGRTYGVAKNVNLVAVKVLRCDGRGTGSALLAGIDWVKGDAKGKKATANMSIGFGTKVNSVNLAVKKLVESGVPTAVAAGNDNKNACDESPASEPTAITVGATGPGSCGGSCVSGNTGIMTNSKKGSRVKQVRNLNVGDTVPGLDANMDPTMCKVEAVGSFGTGVVYGNYTSDHFVFNPKSQKVEEHGRIGTRETVDKYDLIADCPLVEDESGKKFGPMDSDFCGGGIKDLSWTDYLTLHKAILSVVRQSGGFWFNMDSYKDMESVARYAPSICKGMLKCMNDNRACSSLEKSSQRFVDNALTKSAKAKTLNVFSNLGFFNKEGSISALITEGVTIGMTAIAEISVQEEEEISISGAKEDKRACFSNYGTCLDIFAPGAKIKAAYHTSNSAIKELQGTSMASPHVCGALALHLQNGATAAQATALVISQSTRNKVENRGSGSPNLLLYVGGGTPCPSGGSCISGNAGIITTKKDSKEEAVVQVRDLDVGDTVRGYDKKMNPTSCKVEAIGSFGEGTVYGNYTADHFVYNDDTKKLQEHGKVGTEDLTDKYDMISDCPLIEDESGKKFGPMDSDFCGGKIKNLSWKNYLLLHRAILNVVRTTGSFWFSSSSYKNMATVKRFAPSVCKNMLRCIKNSKTCDKLEKSSQRFIDKALTGAAKTKTLEIFTKIGASCEMGSVSSIVTGGESVDSTLIGTNAC